MPNIKILDHAGNTRMIEASIGESLMEAAVRNAIPGIDADCGGACACATCHVYVDEAFLEKVGTAEDMEQSMLDFAERVQPNSRLACQILLSDKLEGVIAKQLNTVLRPNCGPNKLSFPNRFLSRIPNGAPHTLMQTSDSLSKNSSVHDIHLG